MHFANPEYLSWLLVLPIALFLFHYRLKRSRKLLQTYFKPVCLQATANSIFSYRRVYRYSLLLLAFLFLILALARPRGKMAMQQLAINNMEIMILADVSRSMLVEDMGGVSRLTIMKKELRSLLHKLKGQRVGLVAFAGKALLVSPLTLDHSILDMYVQSLSADTLFIQGTDFGAAFHTAWQAFRRGGVSPFLFNKSVSGNSTSRSEFKQDIGNNVPTRGIILASDGEDNEKQAIQVAKDLSKSNVRVFVLGVGSKSGGPIPIYDKRANKIGYKKDSKGDFIVSHFEDKSLKEIARRTKGSFYHLAIGDRSVENIYADIQSLDSGHAAYIKQAVYKEWYFVFVLISLIFGCFYFMIHEKSGMILPWHTYLKDQ